MRKPKTDKAGKLVVDKQTLCRLDDVQLVKVVGGADQSIRFTNSR